MLLCMSRCLFLRLWFEGRLLLQHTLESLHAATVIHQLLFAGEEWMAHRTNFHANLFYRGAGSKAIATGTDDLGICEVFRMSFFFHSGIECTKAFIFWQGAVGDLRIL